MRSRSNCRSMGRGLLPQQPQTERRGQDDWPRKQQSTPATEQQLQCDINSGIGKTEVAMRHPRKRSRRIIRIAGMKHRTERRVLVSHQHGNASQRSGADTESDTPASPPSILPNQGQCEKRDHR